jgi:hypothetical protein
MPRVTFGLACPRWRLTSTTLKPLGRAARLVTTAVTTGERSRRCGACRRRVASFERRSRGGRVVCALEEVGVGGERDGRVGVPELAADEDDIQALCDQQRGVAVAQRVQGEPSGGGDGGAFDGRAERLADDAVVEAAPERVAEDQVVQRLERRREPLLAEQLRDRWRKDDLPPTCLGLERRVFAPAGELAMDADQRVDGGPGEAERFADPNAGVGEETRTGAGFS